MYEWATLLWTAGPNLLCTSGPTPLCVRVGRPLSVYEWTGPSALYESADPSVCELAYPSVFRTSDNHTRQEAKIVLVFRNDQSAIWYEPRSLVGEGALQSGVK